MAKYVIQSNKGAPPMGAYSPGWRAGDFIFVTGSGPIDPVSGKLVGETIEEQTERAIENMGSILEADGASLADVVKVTAHLSDASHFAGYNAVYAKKFSKPYPVRTTVGSDLGVVAGMMLELDCIAYAPEKTGAKKAGTPKRKKIARSKR